MKYRYIIHSLTAVTETSKATVSIYGIFSWLHLRSVQVTELALYMWLTEHI